MFPHLAVLELVLHSLTIQYCSFTVAQMRTTLMKLKSLKQCTNTAIQAPGDKHTDTMYAYIQIHGYKELRISARHTYEVVKSRTLVYSWPPVWHTVQKLR